jgi:signal transduction histidine kinase
MRWPLRYQILVPFAGTMLAVVAVVSSLDAALSARRSQQQIESQLDEVTRTLAEANFPLTDAVLKQTRGLAGADFVLTDERGQTLAASRGDLSPESLGGHSAASAVKLDEPLLLADGIYLHAAVRLAPHALTTEPRVLHILYPQDDLRLARWQAAYPSLVVGSLALIVVAVLATAIARRLSRPILELRQQLGRLVRGDFELLSVPARNDELADLVRSANSLAEQLEEMQRVIKRSERLALLGQLSGGLAHQLRNSVAGARIAVQLHQRHCIGHDAESLEVALRQLTLTESHLQRFLSVGRPSAPQQTDCDLPQIIAEVAALVTPACKHQRVSLERSDHETNDVILRADAEQLRQMLLNLVLNGIEAAAPGGWVRIELETAPASVQLRILDSGAGPSEKIAQRLFEPFVTGKPEGIGLGLPVVRQIVAAHGGTIRLRADRPTCFEVTLPRDGASESEAVIAREAART